MNDRKRTTERGKGYLMSYEDSCDRVPVLWIHGFPLSNQLWDYQIDDLADVARQIAPDLRGFGGSEATEPPCSLETYSADCSRLLDHLGFRGPVVVGGLSMGGYIALDFYRRYPERVAGLILAATRAGADSAEAQAGRDQAAALAGAEGVGPIAEGMLPKLFAPSTLPEQPELVAFVREMMLSASVKGVQGALAAMRDRPDSTLLLTTIDVPTLIIHGQDDQLIPVAEAKAAGKAVPEAKLVILPASGHLPNLEQPEEFNDAVRAFLEQFYGD